MPPPLAHAECNTCLPASKCAFPRPACSPFAASRGAGADSVSQFSLDSVSLSVLRGGGGGAGQTPTQMFQASPGPGWYLPAHEGCNHATPCESSFPPAACSRCLASPATPMTQWGSPTPRQPSCGARRRAPSRCGTRGRSPRRAAARCPGSEAHYHASAFPQGVHFWSTSSRLACTAGVHQAAHHAVLELRCIEYHPARRPAGHAELHRVRNRPVRHQLPPGCAGGLPGLLRGWSDVQMVGGGCLCLHCLLPAAHLVARLPSVPALGCRHCRHSAAGNGG